MKKIIFAVVALFFALAVSGPASAAIGDENAAVAFTYPVGTVPIELVTRGLPGLVFAQATPAPTPPAVTQNTVTTTGPVTSETTINTGTIAGQALMWVASVFGTTIGAALTALLLRLMKNAGFAGSELLRQKLQDMIVNGLNAGAQQAADALKDKGQIQVKNAVVASTVQYVQAHGADTLKQLGIDPNSNIAVEAIKARIETAINDPATPTPAILDPTAAPKVAPVPAV